MLVRSAFYLQLTEINLGLLKGHEPLRRVGEMKNLIGLLIVPAVLAHATTILLQSGVSAGEYNNINGVSAGNYVIPDPAPAWTPAQGGAEWISFENTGYCPSLGTACITLPNSTSLADPTAIFTQTFTDDLGTLLTGSITVWADDDAAVYLDGVMISGPPTLSQSPTDCSPGITCTGAGTTIDFTTTPGTHTLTFDVYQTGGWMFGLMYDGTVSDNFVPVPEPSAWLTQGTALAVLGLFASRSNVRRSRKNSSCGD